MNNTSDDDDDNDVFMPFRTCTDYMTKAVCSLYNKKFSFQ